ncbi:hypothetical protein QM996_11500 [Sinorhizobium chiapasense]
MKNDSKSKKGDTDAAKCARIFNRRLLETARLQPPYVVWNELWYRCDVEKVRQVPVKYLWKLGEALTARVAAESGELDFLKPDGSKDFEFDYPTWETEPQTGKE